MFTINGIDHIVLTVRSVKVTCDFYQKVLGFRREDADGLPTSLLFGRQKINVHEAPSKFEPRSAFPTSGSADFCLVTEDAIREVQDHLDACGVRVELGPVQREGAQGTMVSLYFRDPDDNLTEVSRYGG